MSARLLLNRLWDAINRLRGRTCATGYHIPVDTLWTFERGKSVVVTTCYECKVVIESEVAP